MKLNKILTGFVTAAMFFSSIAGGWSMNAVTPTAFAIEGSTSSIDPGTYAVPVYNCDSQKGLNSLASNSSYHYNSRAKLEIGEDGTQTVTLIVENWSLYEAFVPMDQEYNELFGDRLEFESAQFRSVTWGFPNKLIQDLANDGNEQATTYLSEPYASSSSTDATNNFFLYGDNKYGDIQVDAEKYEEFDWAAVTFEIKDIRKEFHIAIWTNTPATTDGEYIGHSTLVLDVNDMYKVDDLAERVKSQDISYRMLVPSYSMRKAIANNTRNFRQSAAYTKWFDGCTLTYDESTNKATAKYHVADSVASYMSDFKSITSAHPTGSGDSSAWVTHLRAEFEAADYDSTNQLLTLEYDLNDWDNLIYGSYTFFYNTSNASNRKRIFYAQFVLAPETYEVEVADESTGVKVVMKNTQVNDPDNLELIVESKPKDDAISEYISGIVESESAWYKIELKDKTTGEFVYPAGAVTVYTPLPSGMTSANVSSYIANIITPLGAISTNNEYDYTNGYWIEKNQNYLSGTSYYLLTKPSDNATSAVNALEDGVYSGEAYLFKSGSTVTYSMANPALVHDVYIVVKDGVKKVYFDAQEISGKGHLGHIMCNDADADSAYYDSISYTKFAVNEDGSLISNANYDPITEWACVEGGILILNDGSYIAASDATAYYTVAIGAPVMAAIGGCSYEEVAVDDLTAKLQFSNVQAVNLTEDDVKAMFPYDKSALRRQIDLAKTYIASKYTAASYDDLTTALTDAETAYAATYADTLAASNAYEGQITALTNAMNALQPIDPNALPDGRYLLHADMLQVDRTTKSMSDNAINHTVTLDVVDGEYYLNVEFKGLTIGDDFGYLSQLWYYDAGYTYGSFGAPEGTIVSAETITSYDVVDEYNTADTPYPHYLRIKLVDKASGEDGYVPLRVFVPIMEAIQQGGGTQDVLMQLDWSTLKEAGEPARLNGYSLSLSGNIGLNFFLDLSDEVLADNGAKVQFTLPDGSIEDVLVSGVTRGENGYQFTANVAAKEMTDDVIAQVLLSDGTKGEVYTCSVKQYADILLADENTPDSAEKLVKAMLNYGGYAQIYFGHNTSEPANDDLTESERSLDAVTESFVADYEYMLSDKDSGIDYKGSKLTLESTTAIKHYFMLTDDKTIDDYTFTVNGETVMPTKSGDMYYVTVSNISAQNLGTDYAVKAGGLRLTYSPMSYTYSALTQTDKTTLQDVTRALYLYNQAAVEYTNS